MAGKSPDLQATNKCSISLFTESPCSTFSSADEFISNLVFLKDCTKSVLSHLRSLNISYDGNILTEGFLICLRIGIFQPVPFFTVCPCHRNSFGLNWKRKTTCVSPNHSGTCKADRPISLRASYALVSRGIFLPVGSAVCKACKPHISKVLDSFNDVPNLSEHKKLQIEYTPSVQNSENETVAHDQSSHLGTQSDSESCLLSLPSSQISSWSLENEIDSRDPLTEINEALNIIGEGRISPIHFQIRKNVDDLKPRTLRSLKRKASTAVQEVLDCLAPSQSKKVWQLVNENMVPIPLPSPQNDELVVQLYKESTDRDTKKQFLSMICQSYSKHQLMEMIPGISTYSIDQARIHAKSCGKGILPQEKEKCFRQKMDEDKLEHALDFFLNPAFHQVTSFGTKEMHLHSGELVTIPQVVRTACHSTLVQIYQSFCEETDFVPLSRATLFRILSTCPASQRTNLKGLDNVAADGAEGFETLVGVLKNMEAYTADTDKISQLKECKENLLAAKLYLKTDFKAHLKHKDNCADHCMNYALSDPTNQNLQQICNDHTHDLKCDRCDLLPSTVLEIKRQLEHFEGSIPPDLQSDMYADTDSSFDKIMDWKRHVVRTINQDKCRRDMLKDLTPEQAVLVMDWAMKFLPLSFREKQSEWFGQKGINWHVAVCIYKVGNELKNRTFTHCLESTKQDWNAVAQLLEHTLNTIRKQLPHITTVFLRSDNAGCYHCGNLWLSLPSISQRTGVLIRRYDFSEAQSGKSYCDAKIAHMRAKLRKSVTEGKSVMSASDMKTALDECGGVTGCQAAHAEVRISPCASATGLIKGISKLSNIEIKDDGSLHAWRSYNIGYGQKIKIQDDLDTVYNNDERSLKVIADFKYPSKVEGSIKATPAENGFGCPEGCNQAFSSFDAMHEHCLLGDHNFDLQQMTTYDKIKLRWYDACTNLSEKLDISKFGDDQQSSIVQEAIHEDDQGWALKKDKKKVRFSEKVKMFLKSVFLDGENTGSRANPSAVAKNMRVAMENGIKVFSPAEYLEPIQIASYFSRLAAEKKTQSKGSEDIESALSLIAKIEAIEEVSNTLNCE